MRRTLTERAGVLAGGNALNILALFFMPLILTRILSKELFGIYNQATLMGNILYPIFTAGIAASIYYFHASLEPARRPTLIAQSIAGFFCLGLVAAALLYSGSGPIAGLFHNPGASPVLRAYSLYLFFFIAGDVLFPYLVLFDHIRWAVLAGLLEALLRYPAVLLAVHFGFGLPGIFIGLAALMALKYALTLGFLTRKVRWQDLRPRPGLISAQVRYAAPLGVSNAIGTLGQYANRAVAAGGLTATQYAVYTVGSIQFPVSSIFNKAIRPILREEFSRAGSEGRHADIVAVWRESVRKQSLIVNPLFAFLMLFAGPVIEVLYTSAYLESVPVFRVLLVLLLQTVVSFSIIPESLGRTDITLRASAISLIVSLGLSLVLIRPLGLLGPAIAIVAATYLNGWYSMGWVRRLTGVSYRHLFPWQEMGRILGVSMASAAAAYPALWAPLPLMARLGGAGVLFSAVYLFAALRLKLLTHEDRAFLRQVFERLRVPRPLLRILDHATQER